MEDNNKQKTDVLASSDAAADLSADVQKESEALAVTAGTPLKELRVSLTRLSDSELSDYSFRTVASKSDASGSARLWRKRCAYSDVDLSSPGSEGEEVSGEEHGRVLAPVKGAAHKSKRGRGGPPTSGLARAKGEFLLAREEEERRCSEDEVAEATRAILRLRRAYQAQDASDVTSRSEETLRRMVSSSLDIIRDVTKRSKNLKGTMIKSLKVAVDTIREATMEIGTRSVPEELAILKAENLSLQKEVEGMRHEIAQLQKSSPAAKTSQPSQVADEVTRKVLATVKGIVDSRFAGIESQLASFRRQTGGPSPVTAVRTAATSAIEMENISSPVFPVAARVPQQSREEVSVPERKSKAKKKNKKRKTGRKGKISMAAQEAASQSMPPGGTTPAPLSGWNTVVKRGVKKAPAPPPKQKKKVRVPLPPKTAAITLTLQPDAVKNGATYEAILSEAKKRVDLPALGIDSVRFRKAATGARLLEISGEDGGTKADNLVAKLKEVLSPETVKVHRPTKCTELRVVGLDDSVTPEEVVTAVAKIGACDAGLIKAGKISTSGAILINCPVSTAKKVVDAGRIVVGWTSARVMAIAPKPLRCFRCLQAGHLSSGCKAETNLAGHCYKCGQTGHIARDCQNEAQCAVCVAAGKTASHAIGSVGCVIHTPKEGHSRTGSGKRGVSSKPAAPQLSQGSEGIMDTCN